MTDQTPFRETDALLAVMDGDVPALMSLLYELHDPALAHLRLHAVNLARACTVELERRHPVKPGTRPTLTAIKESPSDPE